MKKYLLGVCAVVLAVAFTASSAFTFSSESNKKQTSVRYLKDGTTWSTTNQTLTNAITSSGCPNGAADECARFYDINKLNFNPNGTVASVKNNPATPGQPYQPDLIRKYN